MTKQNCSRTSDWDCLSKICWQTRCERLSDKQNVKDFLKDFHKLISRRNRKEQTERDTQTMTIDESRSKNFRKMKKSSNKITRRRKHRNSNKAKTSKLKIKSTKCSVCWLSRCNQWCRVTTDCNDDAIMLLKARRDVRNCINSMKRNLFISRKH